MFFPVSDPTHILELVPESIVGRKNPLESINHRIRPISDEERSYHAPVSKAVQSLLNASAGVKDLSNASPSLSFLKNTPGSKDDDDANESQTHGTEAAFNAYIRDQIRDCLFPDAQRKSQPEVDGFGNDLESSQKTNSDEVNPRVASNIHALGENEQDVLNRSENEQVALSEEAAPLRIGLSNFATPAEAAARQDVFDLSTVFDPKNIEDIELFGLSDEEEEEEDSDDERSRNSRHQREGISQSIKRLENNLSQQDSGLDAELDLVIGESYGILGDLSNLRKKKNKSNRSKTSKDEDVWAANDSMDVSSFSELVPDMAIEYPFNLDVFQKRAVYRLERDENVFVAAHTSAGKTVVAEYAIALAMQRKTKVIYTSPIKTLSNQKFRDFTARFGNVGIITGDISINPEASCLVMTTEILRSMLYKGADLIRDLSHVIFDECHWLNDPERGVVWEESIIMLPSAVTIVMLSATVPNAMEFAKWVGRTKLKPVYVVSTPQRPVPLSHQIFVKGELYPLFDSSQKRFLEANFRRATTHHKESSKNANVRFGGGRNHAWMPIIKYLRKRDLDPAIFFCFSRKKCDEAADQLHSQDLTEGASDKNQIHLFYQTAIARLSPADRNVPQISRHREMLKHGIGVHHAGVLPIIKEITEVLFQRGLIRILFATETFAMGVNMPARTVVFTAIHKFDSQSHRLLEPGEYVQMAGRAGRRGLDNVGTVILFPTAADFPVESDVKTVLTGTPKPLRSQFRLTYNMILNLLRIDELRVEDVMARSFSEAPAGRTSSTVKKLLQKGNETLSAMHVKGIELERFRELYDLSLRSKHLSQNIANALLSEAKNATISWFCPGRIILVRGPDYSFRVGVIVKSPKASRSAGRLSLKPLKGLGNSNSGNSNSGMAVKALILCGGPAMVDQKSPLCAHSVGKVNLKSKAKQYNAGGLIVEMADIPFERLEGVSSIKVDVNEHSIAPIRGEPNAAALGTAADALRSVAVDKSNWNGLPSLHPRKELGLQALDVEDYWEERKHVIAMMNENVMALIENGAIVGMRDAFDKLAKESDLENKLEMLQIATSDESLQLMPEYKQRGEVLERLGYIDGTSVRLKGRAACEVNTCESIILAELVFEKVLQNLNAVDLAALMCSLVFTERMGDEDNLTRIEKLGEESEELVQACKATLQVLFCLGNIQAECGVSESGYEYMKAKGRFGFVKGVKEWARGKSFSEICSLYEGDVAEGTIVRTVTRLCELLRELKNVGRVIGDPELQRTADEAVRLCRRDVIFAASLYVQ